MCAINAEATTKITQLRSHILISQKKKVKWNKKIFNPKEEEKEEKWDNRKQRVR